MDTAMAPLRLLPEIIVFGGGLASLLAGSFLPRDRQWLTRLLAAIALVAAAGAGALDLAGPARTAMEGAFAVDLPTGVVRIAAALGALAVLALASDEVTGTSRESETYALVLFSTTGTMVLAGADDLLVVAVAFLLTSIPLYGLIGITGSSRAAEATMKTYLQGALFGILLLAGITVLYGVTGSTAYGELTVRLATAPAAVVAAGVLGILAGLLFEAGGVPAHFWLPDAAQGAGGAVAAFLTTIPKLGAVVALYRLSAMLPDVLNWALLLAVLAAASMTLGNLAAYWQQDPRRLLGWSTVSQVGYLLVPVAVAGRSDLALPSLLLYLAGYTATNIAAFAVTTALPGRRDLAAYEGLGLRRPWLAAALVVALLGLVGTPPTIVFVGKLTTTAAVWDGGFAWLAVLVFLNTLASLFYYLRWFAPLYRRPSSPQTDGPVVDTPLAWSSATAVAAAALSLLLGLGAGLLWPILSG